MELTPGLECAAAVWADTEDHRPLRSLQLFSLEAIFIKSAFRNVYSRVHVCFLLICAPRQEGACVGSRGIEKVRDDFAEPIMGFWR